MNTRFRPSDRDPELEEAALWWARLRDDRSQETAAEWLQWSSADARCADAFERVAQLGAQLGALDAASKSDLLAEFAAPPLRRRPRRWMVAAAAAVVAAIGLGVTWLSSAVQDRYASSVGESRDIVLSDGSRLALGGASSLQTRFSARRRDVELQAGEAFFEVAHDAQRPFSVQAGQLSVRAVGTAFEVRRERQRVTITVTQGKVRIGRQDAAAAAGLPSVEASAGQQVVYDPARTEFELATIDPARAASWRERRLEFVNEPLADVVARLNRYSRRSVFMGDEALGSLVFTGSIRLDDIDSWLQALPAIFPVEIAIDGDRITIARAGARFR